jgi:hypothetical protein
MVPSLILNACTLKAFEKFKAEFSKQTLSANGSLNAYEFHRIQIALSQILSNVQICVAHCVVGKRALGERFFLLNYS